MNGPLPVGHRGTVTSTAMKKVLISFGVLLHWNHFKILTISKFPVDSTGKNISRWKLLEKPAALVFKLFLWYNKNLSWNLAAWIFMIQSNSTESYRVSWGNWFTCGVYHIFIKWSRIKSSHSLQQRKEHMNRKWINVTPNAFVSLQNIQKTSQASSRGSFETQTCEEENNMTPIVYVNRPLGEDTEWGLGLR